MTRVESTLSPSFLTASSHTIMIPRPVASRRPRDPPMLMGLPVTTAVTVCRMCIEKVSITQSSCVASCHALQCTHRHLVGIADHSALSTAERNIDYRAFPGHPACQGA